MALRPKYIVVHTAAFNKPNCDRDMIDQWHRQRGWRGIGYHYVIINDNHDHLEDGTIQKGRDINISGAHAKGLNQLSIGICCAGHGDHKTFTEKQKENLIELISDLIDQYDNLTAEHVIGHREINKLVADGILEKQYRTSKTCPGKLVDMDQLREDIVQYRERQEDVLEVTEAAMDEGEIREALKLLKRVPSDFFPNADGELKEFLSHPEVIAFLSE